MAGRTLRLAFLKDTCREHAYNRLALGHTADDQVELFFLRLLRGAGPEGLKGMWPTTPEGLVRPLLTVGKSVILAWLKKESLPYRQDSSNLSRSYLRNRVRLDLLPELERLYNPRLRQAVLRTQALLQEDERLLAREVARVWDLVGRELAPGLFALDLHRFFTLDPGSQKRLLRAAVGKVLGEQDLTAAQVNGLLALAAGDKSGGLISLGAGRVARAGSELHFFRKLPEPPGEAAITLIPAAAAQVKSPPGWRWDLISYPHHPEQLSWPPPPQTAWLDLDKVTFPLTVRYFRPGDRFWPKGAAGAKKLQDFLVDQKIPRWLRPHLPLVESAGHILWVSGLRVAEPVKLTNSTDTLLEIKLSPGTPATRRLWKMLTCRPAAAG
jgi:tRNA(Ile)-lysidine synthase